MNYRAPSRRDFLALTAAGLLSAAGWQLRLEASQAQANGRLRSRPSAPARAIGRGNLRLGLGEERDGSLYVPSSYAAYTPASLVLVLHWGG